MKFILKSKTKGPLTFDDVKLNQLFIDKYGNLGQKNGVSTYHIIANKNGLHSHRVPSPEDNVVHKIFDDIIGIDYRGVTYEYTKS